MSTTDRIKKASNIQVGDTIRLEAGWRDVLAVWESLGFIHVVASDCTGMFDADETVAVAAHRPRVGGTK